MGAISKKERNNVGSMCPLALAKCSVVLRITFPTGNALFTLFDHPLQGLVAGTSFCLK